MAKHRLEDLGRIYVMLSETLKEGIFDSQYIPNIRKKDFSEWFETQPIELREKILDQYIYGIERVKEMLNEIWEIAEGSEPMDSREI